MGQKLFDLEREVRSMFIEREKEVKDSSLRHSLEQRTKEENKGRMLGDIHNLIN